MATKKTVKKQKPSIHPLANRVLIKPLSDEDTKTPSGIILPETVDQERPQEGTVLEVGPGKRDEDGELVPMEVEKGDRVIFTKFGPDEVTIDDEEYLIIAEDSILAVIE